MSNYEPVNNAKLEKQAVKAGVSEDVAAAAFSGKNEYLDWLTASNNYTLLRPELFNSSGAFSSSSAHSAAQRVSFHKIAGRRSSPPASSRTAPCICPERPMALMAGQSWAHFSRSVVIRYSVASHHDCGDCSDQCG